MTSNIWRVLDIFELQGRSIFDENISEANCRKFPSSVVDLHFTALIIEQSSKHKLQTAAGQICRISELVPSEPPAPKFRIPSSPQILIPSPAQLRMSAPKSALLPLSSYPSSPPLVGALSVSRGWQLIYSGWSQHPAAHTLPFALHHFSSGFIGNWSVSNQANEIVANDINQPAEGQSLQQALVSVVIQGVDWIASRVQGYAVFENYANIKGQHFLFNSSIKK